MFQIFVILSIILSIQNGSSEPPPSKLKKVLPAFYGINIYHRIRDTKPKPVYGPPPKSRIVNPKPSYGPPKNTYSFNNPPCEHSHTISTSPDNDSYDIPHDYDHDLTPPKRPFVQSSFVAPPRHVDEFYTDNKKPQIYEGEEFQNDDYYNVLNKHTETFSEFDKSPSFNDFGNNPNSFNKFSDHHVPFEEDFGKQPGFLDESTPKEGYHNVEVVDIPSFGNRPLTHDPSRSTYDTPGALNSYGDPIKPQKPNLNNLHQYEYTEHQDSKTFYVKDNPDIKGTHPDIYDFYKLKGNSGISKDFVKYSVPSTSKGHIEDYFAVNFNVDYLNDPKKRGTQESHAKESESRRQTVKVKNTNVKDEIRYPNHRYDE